jgi:BirA family biotin operon repressor/biotin-[acetyl-CoA-carboxylase] ligase
MSDGSFDLKLISFLSQRESRSGEAIATELGCSRTAVWKHINGLRTLGVEIDAIAGQGYRLKEPLELLQPELILPGLSESTKRQLSSLNILTGTESTNSWLQAKAPGEQHGVVVFSEHQSSGRGRRGQEWVSPFGRNIYLSIGWAFEVGVGELACLPLLVALACCDALDKVGLTGHSIKWPNDILIEGRKLGGCLVEVQGDVSGPCQAVLGIGLNVRMPQSAPGADSIDQPWTDVFSYVPDISRNKLAAILLDSVMNRLGIFANKGFLPFHNEWKTRDALAGQEVRLSIGQTSLSGVALGISDKGGLMLQTEKGVKEYFAGEVSISDKGRQA